MAQNATLETAGVAAFMGAGLAASQSNWVATGLCLAVGVVCFAVKYALRV